MATYYLDFENGNDANDGTTFANRWKTMNSGATSARTAAGDTIRIMGSPDPTLVGNATWNQYSKTVTLAAAVTALVCDCETAWTASSNVTATADSAQFKENSKSAKLVIASAFTTGLLAYFPTGALDLSSYQQVSFWIYNTSAIAAGSFSLRLCSDAAGATTVHTVAIPAIPSTARWVPLTVDFAANLSSGINSVALYQDTDVAGLNIQLDNIMACKASSAPDALTLTSLIGKAANLAWTATTAYALNDTRRPSQPNRNGLRYQVTQAGTTGGAEPAWPVEIGATVTDGGVIWTCVGMEDSWYAIQSIKGTTVLIDNHTNNPGNAGRGYSGATETVPTWRRETIKLAMLGSGTIMAPQRSGTDASRITYSGGWDRTSMAAQSGETWVDGQNGAASLIGGSSQNYITLRNLNGVRFLYAMFELGQGWTLAQSHWNHCSSQGMYWVGSTPRFTASGLTLNNSSYGIVWSNPGQAQLSNVSCDSNLNDGFNGAASYRVQLAVTGFSARNNGNYGVNLYTTGQALFANGATGNNGSGAVNVNSDRGQFVNCQIPEATPATIGSIAQDTALYFHKFNQTADDHRIYTEGGTIRSATDQRHTASGISWKFQPTSLVRNSTYPLRLVLGRLACAAGVAVNLQIWTRRDLTSLTGKLLVAGGQIAGVPADVSVTCTPTVNTWVQSGTLTFTPTETGVVELQFLVWDGTNTNGNFWVDDLTVA